MSPPPTGDPPEALPSFTEIFQKHGPGTVRTLRHLGVREADVPDACQEVFTVAYRRLSSLHHPAALSSWLHAIAWRVARDFRRRKRRKPEVLVENDFEAERSHDDTELQVIRRRQREHLIHLLDQIEESRREIFVLYELGELTMSEIAAIVECPLQTAYARLYAARKEIEQLVQRDKARGKLL